MKDFKMLDILACTKGYNQVFTDFLNYCLYILSVGFFKEDFIQLQKAYTSEELLCFENMFCMLGNESENFNDALGDIFMDYISYGNNGQFFTPNPITDFMAQILGVGEVGVHETICDPSCGSGRMLLSAAKSCVKTNGGLRPFCYGADIDLTCVKMTTINMLLNSIPGEIAWMNSITMEHWKSYKIDLLLINGMWFPSFKILEAGQTSFTTKLKNTFEDKPELKEQTKKKIEAKQLALEF